METVILLYAFASIMRITGALFVAWFLDMIIDMFLAFISSFNIT